MLALPNFNFTNVPFPREILKYKSLKNYQPCSCHPVMLAVMPCLTFFTRRVIDMYVLGFLAYLLSRPLLCVAHSWFLFHCVSAIISATCNMAVYLWRPRFLYVQAQTISTSPLSGTPCLHLKVSSHSFCGDSILLSVYTANNSRVSCPTSPRKGQQHDLNTR